MTRAWIFEYAKRRKKNHCQGTVSLALSSTRLDNILKIDTHFHVGSHGIDLAFSERNQDVSISSAYPEKKTFGNFQETFCRKLTLTYHMWQSLTLCQLNLL